MTWECFRDAAYFHQWCVRPVGERSSFGVGFHVPSEREAQGLCGLLNSWGEALEEVAAPVACQPRTINEAWGQREALRDVAIAAIAKARGEA